MKYGLIGEKLSHSYSKQIHEAFGMYSYELWPMAPEKLGLFFGNMDFAGVNITIPYKENVIKYCYSIDEKAKKIGAINTIINKNGNLFGYNTDYYGFTYLAKKHEVSFEGKTVLLLGNGGTAKTVAAVAEDNGASKILIASRKPENDCISYAEAQKNKAVQIIVNTSPAGMYPNNGTSLVDLRDFPNLEAVLDAVYNPLTTELLYQANALGINCANGLEMLVAQAKCAAELFAGKALANSEIDRIYKKLVEQFSNVSLIGMPGSGKTSLGIELAANTGKKLVDLDKCIEEKAGMTIPEIFTEKGEDYFRNLEEEVTAEVSKGGGQIISTGGGIVLRDINIKRLKQNGKVIWIDCPVEKLSISGGRPLAKSLDDLRALAEKREKLYRNAYDEKINYSTDYKENLDMLKTAYDELWK